VTGIPHHPRAPSGSPVLSIAAAGHFTSTALWVLLVQDKRGTVGFGAGGGGAGVCVIGGSVSDMVCSSGFLSFDVIFSIK